jgi:hypothetical protein
MLLIFSLAPQTLSEIMPLFWTFKGMIPQAMQ